MILKHISRMLCLLISYSKFTRTLYRKTLTLTMLKYILKIIKEERERIHSIMIEIIPEWIEKLEDEDLVFIKKFVLASGSLKEIAKEYDVTYPTVRLRLDRLIQKIKVCDEMDNDPYIALVKRFAVDEKIDFDTAKRLIAEYKKQVEKGGK